MDNARARQLFEYRDGHLYWRESPRQNVSKGSMVGGIHGSGYRYATVDKKHWAVHRLVWLWHHSELSADLDHINGDRADNRIENLRLTDDLKNQRNRKINANNKTGVKGVTVFKGRFRARIQVSNNSHFLGDFDDLELAALVIAEARDKYHGAFARHR